jgi:uncharacterized membrane protein
MAQAKARAKPAPAKRRRTRYSGAMDALITASRLYLKAELRPHRSLTPRGAAWLLVPLVFVNLVFGVFFLVLRAPIVPPFLGLDVAAMGTALWFSFRAADRFERVSVSADEIRVERGRRADARIVWSSAPAFTRVQLDDVEELGEQRVRLSLASRGKVLLLAGALGPAERAAFGRELEAAVKAARAERWPV